VQAFIEYFTLKQEADYNDDSGLKKTRD